MSSWDDFVERLASARIGATFNFYRHGDRADMLRDRLASYLYERRRASYLLVGEAAGYRGARVSGLPFTSERQLTGSGPSEATATVVHRVLEELGIEEEVVLWNIVPTHPHLPGNSRSNRRPLRAEIQAARSFIRELAPGRRVVAIGRVAGAELGAQCIRHPSHGGATAFRRGLIETLGG